MNWRKLGLIYRPSGDLWWAKSYAILPTVEPMNENVIRVYFASLDENLYGRIGFVDLDSNNPSQILFETKEPILDIGELGTFDDSGVNPSCVLSVSGKRYLYYIGWQRCERVPYMLFAGLAIDAGKGSFKKISKIPILDRTNKEPFLRSAPCIMFENGIFKLWYVSGLGWTLVNGAQYPKYVIRYAESKDGIQWKSLDHICINFKNKAEFGLSRPWVVKEDCTYKMWYSIRSRISPYSIGYAESHDGIHWIRKDKETGIRRSKDGWDSGMVCYPCVVHMKERCYLFYNGNQHGSTGFGCAVLEK